MTDATPPRVIPLPIQALTSESFAPFGTVMAALEDGIAFGPQDARLELSRGTPRFYTMRLYNHTGMTVRRITRHRQVTQALASVGGQPWVVAVAPPRDVDTAGAEPAIADIQAFRIPGDVAVMLHRGTWHAGPLFTTPEASFFNLELADTNVTDHHSCRLDARYGCVLELTD